MRSFARDLAESLGTVGCVSALRRTAAGAFTLDEAVSLEGLKSGEAKPLPLLDACKIHLPTVVVDEQGARDARHGRSIALGSVRADSVPDTGPVALAFEGRLIAIARKHEERLKVVRGFVGNDDTLGQQTHG